MQSSRKTLSQQRRRRIRRKMIQGMTLAVALIGLVLAGALALRGGADKQSLSGTSAATPQPTQAATGSPTASPSASPKPSGSPAASASQTGASAPPAGTPPFAVPSADDPSRVKLTFVGDVLLGSTVENVLKQDGYDAPYRQVKTYIQKADVAVANLETPITERGMEQIKEYTYRSSPKTLPAFQEAGFDVVNLANNHSMDYGTVGLLDTFDALDQAGIKRIGAGRDAEEAFRPVIVESKGIKIAFLGFSKVVPDGSWKAGKNHPGVADTYNSNPPVEAIKAARSQADLVVVVAHWGDDPVDKPNKDQTSLAKKYIDNGADLVVGSHPHVLQGLEQYKGKWIAYSLGNFIFTTNDNKATWETIILEAQCGKDRNCELNAVPIYTVWAKPEPMSEDNGRKLLQRLGQISFHAKLNENGQVLPAP